MIPWIVLAFLASCSQASRPRGIRAEVTFDQLNTHCWSDSVNHWSDVVNIIKSLRPGRFNVQSGLWFPMFWREQHRSIHPSQRWLLWLRGQMKHLSSISQFLQTFRLSSNLSIDQDGSDEPGTSACPNGRVFCENAGHKALVIPSGRVSWSRLILTF